MTRTSFSHLLTPQSSFFFIKIAANRHLKVSENTRVMLQRHHFVYHHFRVYDNVSRLFSIDFFFSKMTNFKEKNREIKVLISAHPKMTLASTLGG